MVEIRSSFLGQKEAYSSSDPQQAGDDGESETVAEFGTARGFSRVHGELNEDQEPWNDKEYMQISSEKKKRSCITVVYRQNVLREIGNDFFF